MTKQEFEAWMNTAALIDIVNHEIDGCGNLEYSRIYLKKGQHYRVDVMNGLPLEKFGETGYIRGDYEPIKVVQTETTIFTYEVV